MLSLDRITKQRARKLFEKGTTILLCPCNLSPHAFNGAFIVPINSEGMSSNFDQTVVDFEWYNCNDSETGHKSAYYQEI